MLDCDRGCRRAKIVYSRATLKNTMVSRSRPWSDRPPLVLWMQESQNSI
nr:MAG TPA: hypothetical protein [Microviridae sp.]